MGERKAVQHYIPADFDPKLVPKGKKLSAKDGTVNVRMMLPFSVQCENCHTFLYRGRKFNSKKEFMGGPDGTYLGIKRWRFYIKCTHCSRPLTFLTDPKNADYEMESGGTRNYELHRDKQETQEQNNLQEAQEAKEDPMKNLENRVLESQRELAEAEQLEQIKAMNARHVQLIKAQKTTKQQHLPDNDTGVLLTEEDEALIQSIQFGKQQQSRPTLKRLDKRDEQRLEAERHAQIAQLTAKQQQQDGTKRAAQTIVKVKKKRRKIQTAKTVQPPDLSSLLGGYGSDSSLSSED